MSSGGWELALDPQDLDAVLAELAVPVTLPLDLLRLVLGYWVAAFALAHAIESQEAFELELQAIEVPQLDHQHEMQEAVSLGRAFLAKLCADLPEQESRLLSVRAGAHLDALIF
jgi:hypothetical protein